MTESQEMLERRAERRAAVIGTALAAGAQLAAVGLLLTSAWLIVRAAEQPPVMYLMVAIVGVRFFGIGRAALRYAERLRTHDAALRGAIRRRVAAYAPLQAAAPRTLEDRRRGEVVRQVVADVETVQDGFVRVRVPWVAALVASTVVALVITLVHPVAGAVVAVQAVATAVLLRLVVPRPGRSVGAEASAARDSLASDVTELVHATPDLLALGAAPQHRRAVVRAVESLGVVDRRNAWAEGLGSAVVLVLGAVAATVATVLAAGAARPELVAVVALAPIALLEPWTTVAEAERLRPDVEAANRRLDALDRLPASMPDPVVPRVPADSHLRVEGLAVGWDRSVPVATGIDLDVAPGGLAAVTAPSGGGKSTLALTLARLLEPAAGRITLGGVDLAELSGDQVRSLVGVLGQDEVVFDTTLRENLRIAAPDASDARLLDAVRDAGLGDLVRSSDAGLDLEVGEGGSRLSGGERQRLGLARLLLAGHRVLVLDEPTEHLDAPTAQALLDDVLALRPERSIVLLSHAPWVLDRAEETVALAR